MQKHCDAGWSTVGSATRRTSDPCCPSAGSLAGSQIIFFAPVPWLYLKFLTNFPLPFSVISPFPPRPLLHKHAISSVCLCARCGFSSSQRCAGINTLNLQCQFVCWRSLTVTASIIFLISGICIASESDYQVGSTRRDDRTETYSHSMVTESKILCFSPTAASARTDIEIRAQIFQQAESPSERDWLVAH
jgi:hypothetical protein